MFRRTKSPPPFFHRCMKADPEFRILVVLGILCLLLQFPQFSHGADFDLSVTSVTPEKSGLPGDFVTLIFKVRNTGRKEATYRSELNIPHNWVVMGKPKPISLKPDDEETVFVNIQVPPAAESGIYTLKLTATSDKVSDAAVAEVKVEKVFEISLDKPEGKQAKPDEEVKYSFRITNTGNTQDEYKISVRSSHGWNVTVEPEALTLPPTASKEVTVTLTVPKGAQSGRDAMRLTVTSTKEPKREERALVFTEILPPLPSAVGGQLFEKLDSESESRMDWELSGTGAAFHYDLDAGGEQEFAQLNLSTDIEKGDRSITFSNTDFSYSQDPISLTAGSIDRTLTPLISFYGDGATLLGNWDQFEMFVGWVGEEQPLTTAQLGLNPQEGTELDLSLSRKDLNSAQHENLVTVHTQLQNTEGRSIEIEAGGSSSPEGKDYALWGGGDWNFESWWVNGEIFAIGPDFPISENNRYGFEITQSSQSDHMKERVLFVDYLRFTTETQTPSLSNVNRIRARLTATPPSPWPTVGGELDLYSERNIRGIGSVNYQREDFSIYARERARPFKYYLEGSLEQEHNRITDLHRSYWTFEEAVALDRSSYFLELGLKQEIETDISTGQVLSSTSTFQARLNISPPKKPVTLNFLLDHAGDRLELESSGRVRVSDDLRFTFDSDFSIPPGNYRLNLSLISTSQFQLPLPYAVTKGRIEGCVFSDKDGDGQKDKGESAPQGIILSKGETKVATDKNGYYRFPPMYPGTYEIEMTNLPSNLKLASKANLKIEIEKGQTSTLNIPLQQVGTIKGKIFKDENDNGAKDKGEEGQPDIVIELKAQGESRRAFTNSKGNFEFTGLLPGTYQLALDPSTFPVRAEITTEKQAAVTLEQGETKTVNFGVFQKPKEIIFGRPPVAKFTYQPADPKRGDKVTFDAGLSKDPDGEITEYSWDFDNDGQVEGKGLKITHSFASKKTYSVTLIVEDTDGNEAKVTKVLKID